MKLRSGDEKEKGAERERKRKTDNETEIVRVNECVCVFKMECGLPMGESLEAGKRCL